MTLNEVSNAFYSYFLSNDIFCLAEDWRKIALSLNLIHDKEEQEEEFKDICKLVLKDLEENHKIIQKFSFDFRYILVQPLQSYPQTVQISAIAAAEIGNLVSGANSMNVTTRDIEQLIVMTLTLLDEKEQGLND